jgi:ATP-dependent DNA helicase RecQ
MKDQVDQLQSLGLRATFINSTLSAPEQYARLDGLAAGAYDLVYVVPERFRSPRFLEALRSANLQMLAIDEAHCISEWGHDFRPDYARLGKFRQVLGNPPTIALTATATDAVRRDIVEQLGMRSPRIFITGFARPNLSYEVQTHVSIVRKDEALVEFIRRTPGAGIIYAATRKRCEELASMLTAQTGRLVGAYHAGLPIDDRRQAQDDFMQGTKPIVVATTAFGMGIDKSDVRFVIHYNLPGTLEGYYQEAGRAGRDGMPAHCLLLYSAGDRRIQEFFIESAYPGRAVVAQVYEFLRRLEQEPIELTQQEIKDSLGLPIGADGVGTCEQLLEKAGALERLESTENMAIVRLDSDQPTLADFLPKQAKVQRRVLQAIERLVGGRRYESVYFQPRELLAETELDATSLGRTLRELKSLKSFDYIPPFRGRAIRMLEPGRSFSELEIDFELLEARKAAEFEKLRRVIAFAQGPRCRQQAILDYFGQADSEPCGRCDNCAGSGVGVHGSTAEAVAVSSRIEEVVRIALSGVARSRSRFGKHLIAQMLCGSGSAKITRFGLQKLTTYGLLKPLKQDEVAELLTALVEAGYVAQTELESNRPILALTERGQTLMAAPNVEPLRIKLRPELRLRLEKVKGVGNKSVDKVPTNRATEPPPANAPSPSTREPVARAQPAPSEPRPITNPVPVREVATAPPLPVEPRSEVSPSHASAVITKSPPPASGDSRGAHYWTWRCLEAGFSVEECAAIRGLEREVVLDHALRAMEAGWAVDARWFLSEAQLATLEQVIGPEEPKRLRPLLAQLPAGLRYEDVQLFLKCRKAAQATTTVEP